MQGIIRDAEDGAVAPIGAPRIAAELAEDIKPGAGLALNRSGSILSKRTPVKFVPAQDVVTVDVTGN